MPTTPVAPSAVPDFPALSDRTTYNAKAYAWAVHMDTVYPAEMQALATVTHGNAVEAAASALLAASNGAEQVVLATTQATNAANSATAAASSALLANATAWVSGATYAIGDARYSLIDFVTYRRTTAGAGTIDPSLDDANWLRVGPLTQFNGMAVLTSGTSWTCPAGLTKVKLRMEGSNGTATGLNGAGVGGYLEAFFSVTPAQSYSYVIGAQGVNPGGTTTFTANGVTYTATGGNAASAGSASNGLINFGGDSGQISGTSSCYGKNGTRRMGSGNGIIVLEW